MCERAGRFGDGGADSLSGSEEGSGAEGKCESVIESGSKGGFRDSLHNRAMLSLVCSFSELSVLHFGDAC